ncbi:hypothetical protein TI39_contig395g00016 [Zymoseptoria brevis]|uniref:Uncharacterized protein n=1 Tax=Zymoseptoria brevis TaxID=1047168 RepID=A0A0F4GNB1_9PEZI|nr:hypothetical protein TI39_contig395g00016 [Zymoseptoria brevis]
MASNFEQMRPIWRSLPHDIATMIILENVLTPLKIHGYTSFGRERTQEVSSKNWQTVRNALAISRSTRKAGIHALNTAGAVEHVYPNDPRYVTYTLGGRPFHQPSDQLLQHFRWLFTAFRSHDFFVRMPVPGTLRRVERLEFRGGQMPLERLSDADLEDCMSVWCQLTATRAWMFEAVGGWNLCAASGRAEDIRKLVVWIKG